MYVFDVLSVWSMYRDWGSLHQFKFSVLLRLLETNNTSNWLKYPNLPRKDKIKRREGFRRKSVALVLPIANLVQPQVFHGRFLRWSAILLIGYHFLRIKHSLNICTTLWILLSLPWWRSMSKITTLLIPYLRWAIYIVVNATHIGRKLFLRTMCRCYSDIVHETEPRWCVL